MYSAGVLDHFHSPRNVGGLEEPDRVGTAGEPGRGNYLVLHLKLTENRITGCGFLTFGCPSAIATGSCLTEMIWGRVGIGGVGGGWRPTAGHEALAVESIAVGACQRRLIRREWGSVPSAVTQLTREGLMWRIVSA